MRGEVEGGEELKDLGLDEEEDLPSGLPLEEATRRIKHNFNLYKRRLADFISKAKINVEYTGGDTKYSRNRTWSIILRDMSGESEWRIQRFDTNGFYGHTCMDTFELAAKEVFEEFGASVKEDPGALRRLSSTEEWKNGMERVFEMQRRNASYMLQRISRELGDITYFNIDNPNTLPDIIKWIDNGWEVFTASRSIYGTELVRGGNTLGWFFVGIDPNDSNANMWRRKTLELSATPVGLISNDEILQRVEAHYKEEYPEEYEAIWKGVLDDMKVGDIQALLSAADYLGFPWYSGGRKYEG